MKRAIGVAIIAVVAVISLRTVIAGRGALGDGDDWMLRGKPAEAIRSYEAAARWYVPFAPHVDAAYAKLRGLAGDTPTGLLAWRAIRSAARATRSLWQPHAADLAEADAAIARLAARDPAAGEGAGSSIASPALPGEAAPPNGGAESIASPALPGEAAPPNGGAESIDAREAWHGARLSEDLRANRGAAVLAGLGIAVVLAGAFLLARRPRPVLVPAVAITLGTVCWLVGLYNA